MWWYIQRNWKPRGRLDVWLVLTRVSERRMNMLLLLLFLLCYIISSIKVPIFPLQSLHFHILLVHLNSDWIPSIKAKRSSLAFIGAFWKFNEAVRKHWLGLAAGGANQKVHVFLMDGWFSLIMGGLGSWHNSLLFSVDGPFKESERVEAFKSHHCQLFVLACNFYDHLPTIDYLFGNNFPWPIKPPLHIGSCTECHCLPTGNILQDLINR